MDFISALNTDNPTDTVEGSDAGHLVKSPSKALCSRHCQKHQLSSQPRLCLNTRRFCRESTAEQKTWGYSKKLILS